MNAARTSHDNYTDVLTDKLYRFHGFQVIDQNNERVGLVDWVWSHDTSGSLTPAGRHGEFIGVHLRWLRGSARAIPVAGAEIDMENRTIHIAASRAQIARAPRFSITRRLRTDQKLAIVSHFVRHAVPFVGHRQPTGSRSMIIDRAA